MAAIGTREDGKLKGESPAKAPKLPTGADLPTSYDEPRGNGGETHQHTDDLARTMTSEQGIPVSDGQNSLKAGARGPSLLEDFQLSEKIFHFDHERIPERVIHARGTGAHGTFELTDSLADYTTVDVLGRVGEKTEVFVPRPPLLGTRVHGRSRRRLARREACRMNRSPAQLVDAHERQGGRTRCR